MGHISLIRSSLVLLIDRKRTLVATVNMRFSIAVVFAMFVAVTMAQLPPGFQVRRQPGSRELVLNPLTGRISVRQQPGSFELVHNPFHGVGGSGGGFSQGRHSSGNQQILSGGGAAPAGGNHQQQNLLQAPFSTHSTDTARMMPRLVFYFFRYK